MNEDCSKNQEGEDQAAEPAAGSEMGETRTSRLDAAKAFMRALSAGAEPKSADQQSAADPANGLCRNCETLSLQLEEAGKRASEAESLYKRMAADFENYRRRIDRERGELRDAGVQKVVEALLPALDDLDRALGNLSADIPAEKLLEGLKLVYNRIGFCLEQLGVKVMSAVGEHFDPRYHEPVQQVETTQYPDGCVVQELRKGYTLNDKVIRPALVNVASNTGAGAESQPPDATEDTVKPGEKTYDLSAFEDIDEDLPAAMPEGDSVAGNQD